MTEHLKGPWTVIQNGNNLRIVAETSGPAGYGYGVADILVYRDIADDGPSYIEQDRARLLSLAPEMLEALKPFAALLQDHNNRDAHRKLVSSKQPVFAINDALITIGDLRKACKLIEKIEENR